MFKASFPWAKRSEEQAEREYVESLPTTGTDEVAGNVWIPEKSGTFYKSCLVGSADRVEALELAEEYGITPWIVALLDTSPVQSVNTGGDDKAISSPPKFEFTAGDKLFLQPPNSTPARGRGRPRASSPAKGTPSNKLTSPRKRTTKAVKEASAAAARQASDSLQAALDSAASVTESVADSDMAAPESEKANPDEDKVVVSVQTDVEVNGDVETTHTNVQVKMPADSPELPLPETTEEMVAKAKEMVEEAVKMEGASSSKKAGKRKAEILDADDDEAADDKIVQPAKKPKVLEQEVKKQKVRNRALVGVAATIALGYVQLPCHLGALGY